ncbi:sensor histidine kinase [Streptomyces fuscigenes]|uniref:sensor histidine kinase n=1 Tax=Streptomyces fuscigenes TaxID=1528880 RepID=UPI001F1D3A76|nr:HAMP domain-containing sensor histidine kinase [Streptomyces fuscigenes]MCF3963718.1 HAMP domain-containing histidine kinase [Streptomyces fuscigenes]
MSAPGRGVPLAAFDLATFDLASEQDVFALRRSGQSAAVALGMERQDQVRIATALSELGRDRLGCAGLSVTFSLIAEPAPSLAVVFRWPDGTREGPDLEPASRLVHRVRVERDGGHRLIVAEHPLPPGTAPDDPAVRARVDKALRRHTPVTPADDLRAQTRDLIATLEETRAQREELRRLNEELEETNKGVLALYSELSQELEETNSGVVALHAELEETSRRLRETSEAKTRFWTNISHELRTPVNAIVALTRLLLSPGTGPLNEDQRTQLSLVDASSQTLFALVNDLLDVAKAESGQVQIESAPVDLRTLVGQLAAVLGGTRPSTDVALRTPAPSALPVVVTDEVLLTRILRNLLSNALKFTAKGEVVLEFATDDERAPSWMTFTVTDSGVGIPQDELGRVFEEFYQIRGPHQRGHRGTGLGLPYARTLAELLGGSLALSSTPGAGTRVEVRLPCRPGQEPGAGARPPGAAPAGTAAEGVSAPARPNPERDT